MLQVQDSVRVWERVTALTVEKREEEELFEMQKLLSEMRWLSGLWRATTTTEHSFH